MLESPLQAAQGRCIGFWIRSMSKKENEYCPLVGYASKKAAQAAAYFVSASRNKEIEKLKLIKLMYLAEREFIGDTGHPMFYDELFSLKHGPICSSTLNAINGNLDVKVWSKYIQLGGEGRKISLVRNIARDDLDELSDAEIDTLQSVWSSFGYMTATEIRSWTHRNCPEYTEIERGRIPISYKDMARALGDEDPDEMEDRINNYRKIEGLFL